MTREDEDVGIFQHTHTEENSLLVLGYNAKVVSCTITRLEREAQAQARPTSKEYCIVGLPVIDSEAKILRSSLIATGRLGGPNGKKNDFNPINLVSLLS